MLTDILRELERKERELFARERNLSSSGPESIQARRQRFVDYLLDEVLSQEDILESFGVVGSTEHKDDGLVITYWSQPGFASMREEAGRVSHYQFMAFRQETPFPWLPNFLVLRDKETSNVRLYVIAQGVTTTNIPKIGSNDDLELSYEMPYLKKEGGLAVERGGMKVKEVSRSELCDPHYVFTIDDSGEKGRIFDAFYLGLQTFAKKNVQKIDELRGVAKPEDIDRAYRALKAIVEGAGFCV